MLNSRSLSTIITLRQVWRRASASQSRVSYPYHCRGLWRGLPLIALSGGHQWPNISGEKIKLKENIIQPINTSGESQFLQPGLWVPQRVPLCRLGSVPWRLHSPGCGQLGRQLRGGARLPGPHRVPRALRAPGADHGRGEQLVHRACLNITNQYYLT